MHHQMSRYRPAAALVALALGVGLHAAPAAGGDNEPSDDPPACYALSLHALTGPKGADLTLRVEPVGAGCTTPETLNKVNVKTFDAAGRKVLHTFKLKNVPASAGVAAIDLGPLPRGRRILAKVAVTKDDEDDSRLRAETTALLRPDLAVTAVHAPLQTLTTRPIDVQAEVGELNGDVAATANVQLWQGPTPLTQPQAIELPPGGRTTVTFPGIALATPVRLDLTVRVSDVSPAETDEANDARDTTVEVTENELARSRLLLDSLGGYGTQFNHHVFAKITPAPPGTIGGLEPKVDALEPQLVRIFFNDRDESALFPDRLASFIDVVRMANETGATINITYQTAARARLNPDPFMKQFADVLYDLVRNRGYTNIRFVTIQNEPNSAVNLTLDQYRLLNEAIDRELRERGLREQIGIMAGDLVENGRAGNHRLWMRYIVDNLAGIVDAYSEHIYWNYWDIPRMEFRIKDVHHLFTEELPPAARKPVYLIEYGVRGIQNFPGKPTLEPGYWADGTPISRTNIVAFQQLWFNIESAQLGFSGTAKWDAYWGKFDTGTQAYYTIGPAEEGWPLFPTYHALRMLFQTTARGWQVVGVDPWGDDDWKLDDLNRPYDQPEKEIAAYAGPNGELTLLGLDSHGRDLNAASAETPAYSIGGLPPATTFNLVIWNAVGNGENVISTPVTTNAAGVARFAVPLHGVFALTTVPVA